MPSIIFLCDPANFQGSQTARYPATAAIMAVTSTCLFTLTSFIRLCGSRSDGLIQLMSRISDLARMGGSRRQRRPGVGTRHCENRQTQRCQLGTLVRFDLQTNHGRQQQREVQRNNERPVLAVCLRVATRKEIL